MKTLIAVPAAALLLAIPGQAAAPPFDTPAKVAYMKDLSSGAVLYSKNANMRMPPASMAKMMTVYVAFDLIKKGELKLDQMVTVRPETWRKWHGPAAGSTMFLSPGEQVSVENLLYGIVTLRGTTPVSCWPRNRGNRGGIRPADDPLCQADRHDQQRVRQFQRLAR